MALAMDIGAGSGSRSRWTGRLNITRIGGVIGRIRANWQHHRNLRLLESYPHDLMKDMGYPAAEKLNAE